MGFVHYHFHIAEYGTDWPSPLFLGLAMQSGSQHRVNVAICWAGPDGTDSCCLLVSKITTTVFFTHYFYLLTLGC